MSDADGDALPEEVERYQSRRELFNCPECGKESDARLDTEHVGLMMNKSWVTIHVEDSEDGMEVYLHFSADDVDRGAEIRDLMTPDPEDAPEPDPYEDPRPREDEPDTPDHLNPNREPWTDGGVDSPRLDADGPLDIGVTFGARDPVVSVGSGDDRTLMDPDAAKRSAADLLRAAYLADSPDRDRIADASDAVEDLNRHAGHLATSGEGALYAAHRMAFSDRPLLPEREFRGAIMDILGLSGMALQNLAEACEVMETESTDAGESGRVLTGADMATPLAAGAIAAAGGFETVGPDEPEETGLYSKYAVTKDGEPVDDCFVLEPESDPAARAALEAYADATDSEELERDIREWMTEYHYREAERRGDR